MTILRSESVLNAPIGYRSILVPNGGVFILKQLLSDWIKWDTEDVDELDELDAILSETMALKEVDTMKRIFEGNIPTSQSQGFFSGQVNSVLFQQSFIDSSEIVYNPLNGVVSLTAGGDYLFVLVCRVDDTSAPPPSWRHFMRLYNLTSATIMDIDERRYSGEFDTLRISTSINVPPLTNMQTEYGQYSGSPSSLRFLSRMKIHRF